MRGSPTDPADFEEGQFQGVLEDIRCLGERRFRKPLPDHVRTILEIIPDLQLLRQLLVRILEVRSWDELVTPSDRWGRPTGMENAMKASTMYQAIMEEGRVEEAGRLFLRVGEDRFETGPTPEQQVILDLMLDLITETSRFEELIIRCLHVGSWAELLQRAPPPAAPPRRARGKKLQ